MTMFTNTDSETDATTTRVWFEPNDSRGETVTSSDSSTEKEYQYVTDPKHPVVGTQSNIWNMYGSLFVTLDFKRLEGANLKRECVTHSTKCSRKVHEKEKS